MYNDSSKSVAGVGYGVVSAIFTIRRILLGVASNFTVDLYGILTTFKRMVGNVGHLLVHTGRAVREVSKSEMNLE